MDLKSILSPSEEPSHSPSPQPVTPATASIPSPTPHKFVQKTFSGPVVSSSRTKHGTSPLIQSSTPSALPPHILSPHQHPHASPLISPVPATPGTPQAQRALSTQSIETLADLASMQMHQPTRPAPLKNSSLDSIKSIDSPSRFSIAQASFTSNPRASIDINMMEISKSTARTDFSRFNISDEHKTRLSELAAYLIDVPSAYESHVEMINTLHQAFINYVYPVSTSGGPLSRRDPVSFDLLFELRSWRDNMDKLFAVGQALWLDWLQDESMLARTTEERIAVIEKFRRAVDEETCATKIWLAYGDWVLECHRWANQDMNATSIDEDRLVGREVFTRQMVMETWQDAVENTKNDLALSHLVWNKFIELQISHTDDAISKDQANAILKSFEQRLKTPHMEGETTKQTLSAFMNAHFSQEQYFEIMEDTSRVMRPALKLLEERSLFEMQLEAAQAKGDRDAEHNVFMQYIDWERTPNKRKKLNFDMCNALYLRAELKFPANTTLWEEHINFVLEHSRPALTLLSRATKHCPWSGRLWSQYLLASDRQAQSYEDTESIKHKATNTGVLETAGIEEVLKVHSAWCSYLCRRAFRSDRDEDDADIAEIGIRASMESMSSLGVKLGIGDMPDPSFRLQRIYINFLSESGRWDNARREFDNAVKDYGRSWQFWLRFYNWEMRRWRRFASKEADDEPLTSTSPPHLATAVLKLALDQENLDYPQPIMEALLNHCEDHEDANELQACTLKIYKLERILATSRQAESLAIEQTNATLSTDGQSGAVNTSKRKREGFDEDEKLQDGFKRSKTEEDATQIIGQASESLKRNRENATILVENLPGSISEARIRQYFSSCGVVRAIKITSDGASATVELEDDIAARYAISRDGQLFDGTAISVSLDTGSTVYLTNYTSTMDEMGIRELLLPYGEIISVRFPSLQGNKNRRFCYVQFKLAADAQNAVQHLDGKDVDGHQLICKISNPSAKKTRQEVGADDGTTLFVGGINFKAQEEEVRKAFEQYGTIQRIRMPLHESNKNRNKGIAFVTFSSADEATASLEMNGKTIKGREIKVERATEEQARSTQQNNVTNGHPKSSTSVKVNGRANTRSVSPSTGSTENLESRSERTIYITRIPDVVNEARIQQIAAKHGDVVKCILKTNHQGALVEYASVAQAGKAALALDGYEIDPGRHIEVVSEEVMKAQKPEKKVQALDAKSKPKATMPSSTAGFIKRPAQPGNKQRKGGNLGRKSILLHASDISHRPNKDVERPERSGSSPLNEDKKKTNADFRALMTGSK